MYEPGMILNRDLVGMQKGLVKIALAAIEDEVESKLPESMREAFNRYLVIYQAIMVGCEIPEGCGSERDIALVRSIMGAPLASLSWQGADLPADRFHSAGIQCVRLASQWIAWSQMRQALELA